MMHRYVLALGSNRRHGRHGSPAKVLVAAVAQLGDHVRLRGLSPTIDTPPLGPSARAFANAAALVETALDPPALLALLKSIERRFGRRRGQRWGARVLDLDIILWSGGAWRSRYPALSIPHPALAGRAFVLDPLHTIAGDWRVPGGALRVRHLHARLTRRRATHRSGGGSGL